MHCVYWLFLTEVVYSDDIADLIVTPFAKGLPIEADVVTLLGLPPLEPDYQDEEKIHWELLSRIQSMTVCARFQEGDAQLSHAVLGVSTPINNPCGDFGTPMLTLDDLTAKMDCPNTLEGVWALHNESFLRTRVRADEHPVFGRLAQVSHSRLVELAFRNGEGVLKNTLGDIHQFSYDLTQSGNQCWLKLKSLDQGVSKNGRAKITLMPGRFCFREMEEKGVRLNGCFIQMPSNAVN